MSGGPVDVDAELARFAAGLVWDEIPTKVQARVVDIWLDSVANAVAGRGAEIVPAVERVMTSLTGPGAHVVVGGGGGHAATTAAFLNGIQLTAYTMCDVYRPALCHVTPVVVPALMVAAEDQHPAGPDFLAALAVGLEVTTRLGRAVDYPVMRARGWHAPGVLGPFGAAAAVARLVGADEATMRAALGLAMSQAGGTFAAIGTPAVKFHQARGAVAGLWAARFAIAGVGGTPNGVGASDGGLLSTFGDGGRPAELLDGLGEQWELEQIALRRWPGASSLQTTIEAVLELAAGELREPGAVRHVSVALPAVSYELCAPMGWDDELSSMQSPRYVVARLLHDRECWIETYGADRRRDRTVAEMASAGVDVVRDDALPSQGVRLIVTMDDDRSIEVHRELALGDPQRPLARRDVQSKLVNALAATDIDIDPGRLEQIADCADVAALVGALGGTSVGAGT